MTTQTAYMMTERICQTVEHGVNAMVAMTAIIVIALSMALAGYCIMRSKQ